MINTLLLCVFAGASMVIFLYFLDQNNSVIHMINIDIIIMENDEDEKILEKLKLI